MTHEKWPKGTGLFVALRGEKSDGHDFIEQAIERGASVIVAERMEKQPRVTMVEVEDSRTALADLAAAFYGYPARKLKYARHNRFHERQDDDTTPLIKACLLKRARPALPV